MVMHRMCFVDGSHVSESLWSKRYWNIMAFVYVDVHICIYGYALLF